MKRILILLFFQNSLRRIQRYSLKHSTSKKLKSLMRFPSKIKDFKIKNFEASKTKGFRSFQGPQKSDSRFLMSPEMSIIQSSLKKNYTLDNKYPRQSHFSVEYKSEGFGDNWR